MAWKKLTIPREEGNTLDLIYKTKKYLDYLHKHIQNVSKAWTVLVERCSDMSFIRNDSLYFAIDKELEFHDLSKLSPEEFIPYRKQFFPVNEDEKKHSGFAKAWKHHKENNLHHWETWTQKEFNNTDEWQIHCVHMVVDWMAMGYQFGDTAQEYYEKNNKINLPQYAVDFIYEIFRRLKE